MSVAAFSSSSRHASGSLLLSGKTVVVTGASRGIGAACAIACAGAGAAELVLVARSRHDLERVAHGVTDSGAVATVRPCDVTDASSLRKLFAYIDRVDVLVNCAGSNQPEPFTQVKEKTLDWLWELNVKAPFLATQAAAKRMIEEERPGVIINISSQMGHVGAPLRSVYCTTKHALEGLTKAAAVELAPYGIRVVSVAPTFVRTEMTARQLDDPQIGPALLEQIPLGRFATAEEVASAVVYVASPAAAMVTGTSIEIDGGWTAR